MYYRKTVLFAWVTEQEQQQAGGRRGCGSTVGGAGASLSDSIQIELGAAPIEAGLLGPTRKSSRSNHRQ